MTAVLAFALAVVLGLLLWRQHGEIQWLRAQLAERRDHEHRVERAQAGLPEVKVQPAGSDAPPPGVAVQIEALIGQWDSAVTQDQYRADVGAFRRDGVPWEEIPRRLQEVMEE